MHLKDAIGFLAVPEYYFTRKLESAGGGDHLKLYSEERDELYGKLLTLSDRLSHTVILPGTVTWRRQSRHRGHHRNQRCVDLGHQTARKGPLCGTQAERERGGHRSAALGNRPP